MKKDEYYFERLVDKKIQGTGFDELIIDLVKPKEIRISFFKNNHFQDELYLCLDEEAAASWNDKVDLYPLGQGYYCNDIDIYSTFDNKTLVIDYYDRGEEISKTSVYNIQELFEKAY